jgi:beta-glucosidase
MQSRFSMLLFVLFTGSQWLLSSAETPAHSAVTPAPREGGWMNRHESFNQKVQANQGNIDLVFIGDSITQGWEGRGKMVWETYYGHRKALNLGIGGDRTQHVLWRLDHGNMDGIQPKVAVVMIGTNNSGDDRNTANEMVDGVTAVVEKLRAKSPDTKILLLAIFPRGETFNDQRGKILQVNQAIRKLQDNKHVFFLDIGHRFMDKNGVIPKAIMPDFLHFSTAGYGVWAQAIESKLASLLGDEAVKAIAAELNGTWTFSINGPDGQVDSEMKLRRKGAQLFGSIVMGNDREFQLEQGGIFGNRVEFTIRRDRPQGGEAVYQLVGELKGGKLEGEVTATLNDEKTTQPWWAVR